MRASFAVTLSALFAAVLCVAPAAARAADDKVRIAFTGDNGGEVSPCG